MANSLLPNAGCRPDCTLERCGDGITDTPLEVCDDGALNGQVGDRCDAQCQLVHASPAVLPATIIDLPFTQQASSIAIASSAPSGVIDGGTQTDLTPPPTPTPPGNTSSGPETLAIMAAGASAGYAFMKRKRVAGK